MLKFDFLSLLSQLLKNKVLKRFCSFFLKFCYPLTKSPKLYNIILYNELFGHFNIFISQHLSLSCCICCCFFASAQLSYENFRLSMPPRQGTTLKTFLCMLTKRVGLVKKDEKTSLTVHFKFQFSIALLLLLKILAY